MRIPLYPVMFCGLGLVAFWLYVRFPALRPASIARAMARVVLALATFAVLPIVIDPFFALVSGRLGAAAFVVLAVMPAFCYVLLSWLWLLARVVHEIGPGNPRGGHPVPHSAR